MMPDRRFCCAALLIALLVAHPVASHCMDPTQDVDREAAVSGWGLRALGELLGQRQQRRVEFQETRISPLLTRPLKLAGTLTFTAPSHLEKHVKSPYEERYLINDDVVSFESSETGVSRTLSLEDFPSLRGFVEGLRAAFTGQLDTLAKFFHLLLEGDQGSWRLTLDPRHDIMRDAIQFIRITGAHGQVRTMEIRETSGDHSRIEMTPEPR